VRSALYWSGMLGIPAGVCGYSTKQGGARRPKADHLLLSCLLAPAIFLGWTNALHAAGSLQIEQARQAVVAGGDLQLKLPVGEPPPASLDISLPRELLWILVGGGVLAALYYLRDVFPGWRRRMPEDEAVAPDIAAALAGQAPGDVLQAADELARQGRYVEAMHVLLLKCLSDLRQRLGEQFADSMTSREILRRARLTDTGHAALRDIVLRVEWTYFGEHAAGAPDYEACRRRFDDLTAALAAGHPA
jgi:hypothetical protein